MLTSVSVSVALLLLAQARIQRGVVPRGSGTAPTTATMVLIHTVACSRSPSSLALPMPGTSVRESTLAKGPWESRYSTIRWARAGPIPGSFSNSEAEAVLILTVPDAPPSPDFPGAVRAPEAASPPGWGAGSGRTSPMRGTRILLAVGQDPGEVELLGDRPPHWRLRRR